MLWLRRSYRGRIETTCSYHADRETGRSCTRCGRPACSDCLREASVGAQCRDCVAAAGRATSRRVRFDVGGRPPVTTALVAVNLVIFVLASGQGISGGRDLQGTLALFGPAVAAGDWYRLVSSGFVHFGLIHVGFNMLALYRFGGMFETTFGRLPFAGLFVASLLSGSLGALVASPDVVSGGASGAVFGIIGATVVMLRRRGLQVWQTDVGGLLLINLVLTFVLPGISVGGHLGGLIGGAAVALATADPPLSRQGASRSVAVAVAVSALALVGAVMRVAT